MIFQFMWSSDREDLFEQAVPVLWHGEHLLKNGWGNPITLCFLNGLESLSSGYREYLVRLGYRVLDCAPLTTEFLKRYPRIRKLSINSRFWFLRWNVLQRLAAERVARTVLHLDGDVVLLVDPNQILRDVEGSTFMLQGCPALTVISDPDWFSIWEEELALLLEDRVSYLKKAHAEKVHPRRPGREYCNVCTYSGNHFEDQEMLQYLIAAGRLPQALSAEIFDSPFYWMQNPLLPGDWHEEQAAGAHRLVVEKDGYSLVGDKRVALYHFQTDFAKYCSTWLQFSRFGLDGLASSLRAAGPGRRDSRLVAWTGRLLDRAQRRVNRRAVYENVFKINPATGHRFVTDIVNSCWE